MVVKYLYILYSLLTVQNRTARIKLRQFKLKVLMLVTIALIYSKSTMSQIVIWNGIKTIAKTERNIALINVFH